MKRKRKRSGENDFGSLALKWRDRHNLTRVEAARQLGVPYRTLEDWEAARRTPRSILRDLLSKKFNQALAR
jgi:predicted transcriptional regulator